MCIGGFSGGIWTSKDINLFSSQLLCIGSNGVFAFPLRMFQRVLYLLWLVSVVLAVSIGDYPLTRRLFSSVAIVFALCISIISGPFNLAGRVLVLLTLFVGFYTSYITLHHEF